MFLPQVKNSKNEISFFLPFKIKICVEQEQREKFQALLGHFFPGVSASFADTSEAHITAVRVPKKVNDEEYRLEVKEGGIYIEYFSYLGLRNAAATIAMTAEATDEGFYIKTATIEDYPVLSHRGIMLDLARGIKNYEMVCADAVLAAKSKMNYLHLHLFDSIGVCMELDSMPEKCRLEGYYTKEQMKELIKLGDVLGLELIPEFDMPAHATKLPSVVSEISCDIPEDVENTNWTVCPSTEATYKFYEAVINELVELFPSKYFHIGADELEFLDLPELKQTCHWHLCSKCKKLMEQEGFTTKQELYYYFILKIYEIVKKTGRTMVMWSDQIDCDRECPLPRDIIMHFWRVAAEGRGPTKNCSMNALLKMGYKVINSHYPETYNCAESYMSAKSLRDWRWDERPECDEELKKNVFGSELCVWEYGNEVGYYHYYRTLAPTTVIMGDKLWNGVDIDYTEEYETALTRAVLGAHTPKGLNIFKCFGSVLPPRCKEFAYYDDIRCTKEEIKETLSLLESMKTTEYGNKKRAEAYIESLKAIIEKLA